MKSLLCGLLSLSALAGASAATAYEALRVVGKQKSDALLDRVIEVRGTKGVPQPRSWKVVVLDDKAANGTREFDVQGANLGPEKTPQAVGAGRPMNMNQLNLDSDGAHTVAEREAKKNGFAYDHVNYILRSAAGAGSPVWELRLVDEQNGNIAILTMAADTGKLLNTNGLEKGSAPVAKVVGKNRPNRSEDGMPPEEELDVPPGERRDVEVRRVERREERREEVDKPGNKVTRFFDRAGRHIGGAFQRFGDRVERTFNGEPAPRRVERRATPAPQPRSNRDSNGTEYYRPRD